MWGIVPAAGVGSRIRPLAFSKELLPVGSVREGTVERPRAISEYLVERMVLGGADKLCFVISPGKSDILEYYGAGTPDVPVCYAVQPEPAGLCDALFRALPLVAPDEHVLVGLPDTIWFPNDGLRALGDDDLSFLCFPVDDPSNFDAVVSDDGGEVLEVQVKRRDATTSWIWGAFKIRGRALAELHRLWIERERRDPYVGTLVTAWLSRGGRARAVRSGCAYVDTGTIGGYRSALRLLDAERTDHGPSPHGKPQVEQRVVRVANGPRATTTPLGVSK